MRRPERRLWSELLSRALEEAAGEHRREHGAADQSSVPLSTSVATLK
jgi:hypothetical protein